MNRTWQLQEAKARLSELVERALKGEPQVVTRHGRRAVVILGYETYSRLSGERRTLWEALRAESCLPNSEIEQHFERQPGEYREVEL